MTTATPGGAAINNSAARSINNRSAGSASSRSGHPSGSGNARLLYRGKLLNHLNKPLHGIAIVAHLFNVPFPSPQLFRRSSPNSDDPFASTSSSSSNPFAASTSSAGSGAADMCLLLEMMRGRDLRVVDPDVRIPRTEIETPTDVRVYVDPRCPETVTWFEGRFCVEGVEDVGRGVRIEVGGEELIIFAEYPPPDALDEAATSGIGRVVGGGKPVISLLLGRQIVHKARPDDPMPRESLFASKLRRTNSLPVLSFDLPKSSRNSSSSARLPPPKSKPSLSRSSSTSSVGPFSTTAVPKQLVASGVSRRTKAKAKEKEKRLEGLLKGKKIIGSGSRAGSKIDEMIIVEEDEEDDCLHDGFSIGSQSQPQTQSQRSQSQQPLPLRRRPPPTRVEDSEEEDDDEDDELLLRLKMGTLGSRRDVPGSPTPSIATTQGGEEQDTVSELGRGSRRSRPPSVAPPPVLRKRKGLARSTSAPVGVFGQPLSVPRAPSERERSVGPVVERSIEERNKSSLKKLLDKELKMRNVLHDHPDFRNLFNITRGGVQFALRAMFASVVLDKDRAAQLISQHLDMYLPSTAQPLQHSQSLPLAVKQEPSEMEVDEPPMMESHLPSPRSQEVMMDSTAC
ncbi:hypothetical protein T439DRAFT_327649 [Meredithblackwellia eburnea MCA 4105]